MTIPLFQVDAFTSTPFRGNPAAVCLLEEPRDDAWLQAVAAEMNLSETAFVRPVGRRFELRWFTPTIEVPLCGHATLASAHVLFTEQRVAGETIEFETKSGVLTARRRDTLIELDFPAAAPEAADSPDELIPALGVAARFVGRNQLDWIVEVEGEREVREASPDFRLLSAVNTRGVMITATSDDAAFDFVSRYFAPAVGIDEDPVTGSAHCCLGPFWSERLGKDELVGHQVSVRGGVVHVRPQGDRVLLRGEAVGVLRGTLTPEAFTWPATK
ncbi:MAG: PhzF family phenazine biosynthesis isomerase [Pirellulaceae bacterium]